MTCRVLLIADFGTMDGYDHLFKLLLIGDAGVGKSRYV